MAENSVGISNQPYPALPCAVLSIYSIFFIITVVIPSRLPSVVEVLVRTGGFSTCVLLSHLLETLQWLVQVTHDIAALKPSGEGDGHMATVRLRLLHATFRQRIRNLTQRKPSYFDTSTYGVPANAIDSMHSISVFSCSPMWLQLPQFGVHPTTAEITSYIALFRYLAYLLGAPHAPYFAGAETARRVMESMLVHEMRITETSHVVAYNFLQVATSLPSPFYVSMGFAAAGSRWINGDELCNELKMVRRRGGARGLMRLW
ncbi:oxygenase MpaB family protein [Aspergillus undulatus]|uniref:oxygenase MpaB family protein n=1 Tax=Aspergillus undulatus TaxID=1810928 RepID=UPI003CCCD624